MKITLLGSELNKTLTHTLFPDARVYHLRPVGLLKAACPRDIAASTANMRMMPVIIEKNRKNLGKVAATGYAPKAIVVGGAATRHAMLEVGVMKAMAWIEAGLDIQADDAISCAELGEKLQAEITARFYGATGPTSMQPYPYIVQVYPFENYMIYCMSGQKYRQGYNIDPVGREVSLAGHAVKVQEQYVNAANNSGMPKVETGLRTVSNPIPLSDMQVSWRGGATCELMTQVVRNSANIDVQVAKLRSMIRAGLLTPMVPDFAPVALGANSKVLTPFIKAGIAPVDMLRGMEMLEGDKRGRAAVRAGVASLRACEAF